MKLDEETTTASVDSLFLQIAWPNKKSEYGVDVSNLPNVTDVVGDMDPVGLVDKQSDVEFAPNDPLQEMTTSANIATVPMPFIMIRKRPWPFDGDMPQIAPLAAMRKKAKDKYRKFYGPIMTIGAVGM
jgi:hypothetical protein